MKAVLFNLIICLLLAVSCDEDNGQPCNVENPVQDLDWLADATSKMDQFEDSYVAQALYKRQTVFIFGNCCITCNSVFIVYDCSGNQLGSIGERFDWSLLNNAVIIWKAHDSHCTLQ